MMKKAFVNGEEIPQEAVQHEFDRLARLYLENGMSADELKKNVEKLLGQAQEQAIGAKLLLLRKRRSPPERKKARKSAEGRLLQFWRRLCFW